jgi:hypothetical protein
MSWAAAFTLRRSGQRVSNEIWRYGADSRARSAASPDAITAVSNSSAVATTNASTAFADDMRVRVRRAPARCAISRVRSATTIAPRFRTTFTAASKREPRQTSASTGAGTRSRAPRSCATRAIARARVVREARAPGLARALSASESRISASAKPASHASSRPRGSVPKFGPVHRGTVRALLVQARAQQRAQRTRTNRADRHACAQPRRACGAC